MTHQPLTHRASVLLRRYLPAECVSLAATLVAIQIALAATDNLLVAALAGTWADSIGYYTVIVGRELWQRGRSLRATLGMLRDLVLEFGTAELLDGLLVRPAALYAALTLVPAPVPGAILGKLVADVVFYLPTITSYELLHRHRTRPTEVPEQSV